MESVDIPVKFDFRYMRPQELERLPLSGKTVKFKSRTGGGISFRGREYKPDADRIVTCPIEAVEAVSGAAYSDSRGKLFTIGFDIIEEPEKPELV